MPKESDETRATEIEGAGEYAPVLRPVGGAGGPDAIMLSPRLYQEAYSRGMNLSALLEQEDPSESYRNDPVLGHLDAFQRQLYWSGIRVRSNPQTHIWASKVEDFYDPGKRDGAAKCLFPEFLARVWRSVGVGANPVPSFNNVNTGDEHRFYMSSNPVSDVMYPDYIQTVARQKQIVPELPLSRVVALTTPIDSETYTAFYLTDDSDERSMVRVAEGAPVPSAYLTGSDHTVRVKKYGRALIGTYETFRRMRVDRFALHLALLAMQAEQDKIDTAVDVAISGDGNASTAATNYNKTTLNSGLLAGDQVDLTAYLSWRMRWDAPYRCDLILARTDEVLDLLLLTAGTANVMYMQIAGMFGIGSLNVGQSSIRNIPDIFEVASSVSANTWLGMDTRFAIEMIYEIGTTLVETDKIIQNQYNMIVMTESVGFCVFDQNASKTATLNA